MCENVKPGHLSAAAALALGLYWHFDGCDGEVVCLCKNGFKQPAACEKTSPRVKHV